MPSAVAGAVGTSSDDDHSKGCGKIRNGAEKSDHQIAQSREGLNDLRQPEAHTVEAHDDCKVNQAEVPHSPAAYGIAQSVMAMLQNVLTFLFEPGCDPGLLGGAQPTCVPWPIRKVHQCNETENDRRQTFNEKQPLPACESCGTTHFQQSTRSRAAHHTSDRGRCHKARHRSAASLRGKPVSKVENHAWKKSCFRNTKKESQCVKGPWAPDKHHG